MLQRRFGATSHVPSTTPTAGWLCMTSISKCQFNHTPRRFDCNNSSRGPILSAFLPAVLIICAFLWFDNDLLAVDYTKDVKPLLQSKCVLCHGTLRAESGLRLDFAGGISLGGDRGQSVIANAPAESLLIQAIEGTTTDIKRMPEDSEPLSAAQIQVLRQWITDGATMPNEPEPFETVDHWAYQLPQALEPKPDRRAHV